jgi:hypothetical protein
MWRTEFVMGRVARSIFVGFGVVSLLMCHVAMLGGLSETGGARAATLLVFFAGEMFSLGFVLLLQRPFFPAAGAQAASSRGRMRLALAIPFGLLQVFPGVGATLIGILEGGAATFVVGVAITLTAILFIGGGLRGLLQSLAAPETLAEG